MGAHTPGPWKLGRRGFKGTPCVTACVSVDHRGRPTTPLPVTVADDIRSEDDARLIAAAPDLLEALQGVLEGLPFAGTESEYELVQAGCTLTEAAQLAKAFAAIARAQGDAS